jgi:tRNA (guanine37-N1)-methyltransferase
LRKRLKQKLQDTQPNQDLQGVYSSFDLVGDIAIIKVPNPANAQAVADQIMGTHKKLRAVYSQTSAVEGNYRIRKLNLLAGQPITEATYKENGCLFRVDIEKCYFSPRLSHERNRIASLVCPGEVVVNMFAGVGCFSIQIAKKAPDVKVYSIDINPHAYEYMQQNVGLNHVDGSVVCLLGDAKEVIETQLRGIADRVLMPLPELALQYLPYALSALKQSGGWIHFHAFEHAAPQEKPTEKTKVKVGQALDRLGVSYRFVGAQVVRSTGPNWWQTVLDIQVGALDKFISPRTNYSP